MIRVNKDDVISLIFQEEPEFKFRVDLNIITKFQLYLTGQIIKGVEIFGIGLQEIRGFAFLYEFHEEINKAKDNNYRIFIKKDGNYFGKGIWYLEFYKQ